MTSVKNRLGGEEVRKLGEKEFIAHG